MTQYIFRQIVPSSGDTIEENLHRMRIYIMIINKIGCTVDAETLKGANSI
jgi:hypothetical protein